MTTPKTSRLPIHGDITTIYMLSLVIAALMGVLSLLSLIQPEWFYASDELVQTYLPNDVVNIIIGLPILLGALLLSRRGMLVGLLLLPGGLVYVLYNYIAYIFGIPFSIYTLGYLALVVLSTYTLFVLLRNIDKHAVATSLSGKVPIRLAGWVLVVFGAAFVIRAVGMLVPAFTGGAAIPVSEYGVLFSDLVISALWIAGGILLLQRKPLGYVGGLGLLFVGSVLFVALIVFLMLQPILTGAPFVLVDVIVVFLMGVICSIPFGMYLRGVRGI